MVIEEHFFYHRFYPLTLPYYALHTRARTVPVLAA